MKTPLVISAWAFVILGTLPAQDATTSLRVHDLRALELATEWAGGGIFLELPLRASVTGAAGESYARRSLGERLERDRLDTAAVAGLLRSHVTATHSDPDLNIDVTGPLLLVKATAKVHQTVTAFLGWIEEEFTRSLEVELVTLPRECLRTDHGGGMTREEVDELLGSHVPLTAVRTSLRLGAPERLRTSHRAQIVANLDVEVAEEAVISDPLVQAPFEGTEALVTILPTLEGGYLVQLELRAARGRGEPERIDLSQGRTAAVQVLQTDSTLLAASALLAEGGGLLVGHDAPGGTVALLRLLPEVRGARAPQLRGSRILPLGQLLDRQRRRDLPVVLAPNPSGFDGRQGWVEDRERSRPLVDEDVLEAWKQEARDRGAAGFARLVPIEGRVIHQGAADQGQALRALAAAWTRRLGGAARLDLRLGRIPNKEALALRHETEWDDVAKRLDRRATAGARIGDSMILVGGRERSFIKDYDVEIAKKAVIADPIMDSLFDGFGLEAALSPRRDGRRSLRAHFLYQTEVATRAPYESGITEIGPLTRPVISHVEVRPQLALENGRWSLLVNAPLANTEDAVIALIRARW